MITCFIGIDAHTTNYTLSTAIDAEDKPFNTNKYGPKVTYILRYANALCKKYKIQKENILLGYEAGCLGFKLQRDLNNNGFNCVVMAPSTIPGTAMNRKKKKKTDYRDAEAIAKALRNGDYSAVATPDEEDEAIRDFIHEREAIRMELKRCKQRIGAFCNRHGNHYEETGWTNKHIKWLKDLTFTQPILKETLESMLLEYEYLSEKLEEKDKRIEEFANMDKYKESVHKLVCFKGIKTLTALAVIVEIGDFARFMKAKNFVAFLGLSVGEQSSSTDHNQTGITKQGNRFIRRLLTEAAQCFSRTTSKKSKELKKRQEGNSEEIIAYADKANDRLRKRYAHLVFHNMKSPNKAKTAIARELSCFIWGMMTGNIHTVLSC